MKCILLIANIGGASVLNKPTERGEVLRGERPDKSEVLERKTKNTIAAATAANNNNDMNIRPVMMGR